MPRPSAVQSAEPSSNRDHGTILIADSQYLTTAALTALLLEKGYTVEMAESRHELIGKLKSCEVSLIITDYILFDYRSINDLKEIIAGKPEIPVLVLSNSMNQMQIRELNQAGIKNIALKTDDRSELLQGVSSALKKKKAYTSSVLDILLHQDRPAQDACLLTTSEIDIVRLISSGLSTKEIAAKKHVSFHTVMTHRKNIFRKLGVSSSQEMMLLAIKAGLIDNIEYHI
ncbi:response regulator transcription factor [Chlorobaculum sp. MV4-Y]|jgi:DNA-binding NarL/FixJ family response regulator|uniref:response regulator transcription factor n=1 Tax=Chlorobaculum sp. MV4-Y TaxID=2976335 RepID=UPI0021AFD759|nr:response regulator transcription factor [Chlorobaculum sp. MV4-Y]UWX56976.1 response regulator transcription factor [Chlorobaculum sp. MV4-Y]